MAKHSFIILFSVQFSPDNSLLFLLEWQALQLRHTSEMREKCAPLKSFLSPTGSLKQGALPFCIHFVLGETASLL